MPKKGGGDQRAYLLQTGEKGIRWIRLTAHGRAGHGSVPNDENAIARLAAAIGRIDAHVWPREYVASVRQLLDGLSDLTGVSYADNDATALLLVLVIATLNFSAIYIRNHLREKYKALDH